MHLAVQATNAVTNTRVSKSQTTWTEQRKVTVKRVEESRPQVFAPQRHKALIFNILWGDGNCSQLSQPFAR